MTLSATILPCLLPRRGPPQGLDFADKHCSSHRRSPGSQPSLSESADTPLLYALISVFFSKQVTVVVLILKNLSAMSSHVTAVFVKSDCTSRCPAKASDTRSLRGLASADTEKQNHPVVAGRWGGAPGQPLLPLGSVFFFQTRSNSLYQ